MVSQTSDSQVSLSLTHSSDFMHLQGTGPHRAPGTEWRNSTQGLVVTIFTTAVTDTGSGYLSQTYTSQYADPANGQPRGGLSSFKDTFTPLPGNGPWVLQERVIETAAHGDTPAGSQTFRFEDLEAL